MFMGSDRGHLTPQEREGYLTGTLAPSELLSADDHLQTCDSCMTMICAEAKKSPHLSVADLALADDEHLSFDRLSRHVDGGLDAVESSIVALHLEDCEACRLEVSGLVAVRKELDEEQEAARASAPDRRRKFWRSWKVLVPAFAVLAGILFLWFARSDRPLPARDEVAVTPPFPRAVPDPTPSAAPTVPPPEPTREPVLSATVSDAGRTIGINDQGTLTGFEALPPGLEDQVRKALLAGSLTVGRGVDESSAGVLMGGKEGVKFGLSYPVGEVVLSQRPRFRWGPIAGASTYRVRVFDDEYKEVLSSPELTKTDWVPSAALRRGRSYRWQVTAKVNGEEVKSPVRPAPDAVFRVVDADAAEEVEYVRRRYPDSNLLRGLAYAKAGLRREAEREFAALLRRNPKSRIARKLLDQVRRRR